MSDERVLSLQLSGGSIRSRFVSWPRLLGRKWWRCFGLNLWRPHRSDRCNIQTAKCARDREASGRLALLNRFDVDEFVERFIQCPDVGALAAAKVRTVADADEAASAVVDLATN